MRKKIRDLSIIGLIYFEAYALGYAGCFFVEDILWKCFVFDGIATVVTFFFSVILVNSSVYDAYWSLTPMVISLCLFAGNKAFSFYQILFLIVFNLWSVRLTVNWMTVFTDFSYEDWRYRKYREETKPVFWPVVNFFGIHFMPTVIVFGGMLPLFEIVRHPLGAGSVPGILVMMCGIALEFFADRQMHAFLKTGTFGQVCENGLWKYSRHPNYLGEITVWLGVYLTMLPYAWAKWYYGIGFLCVGIMFLVISIPLMEKRQKARRPEYTRYCQETHRLLLLPRKHV